MTWKQARKKKMKFKASMAKKLSKEGPQINPKVKCCKRPPRVHPAAPTVLQRGREVPKLSPKVPKRFPTVPKWKHQAPKRQLRGAKSRRHRGGSLRKRFATLLLSVFLTSGIAPPPPGPRGAKNLAAMLRTSLFGKYRLRKMKYA